jgi:hypothetical protein
VRMSKAMLGVTGGRGFPWQVDSHRFAFAVNTTVHGWVGSRRVGSRSSEKANRTRLDDSGLQPSSRLAASPV